MRYLVISRFFLFHPSLSLSLFLFGFILAATRDTRRLNPPTLANCSIATRRARRYVSMLIYVDLYNMCAPRLSRNSFYNRAVEMIVRARMRISLANELNAGRGENKERERERERERKKIAARARAVSSDIYRRANSPPPPPFIAGIFIAPVDNSRGGARAAGRPREISTRQRFSYKTFRA